MILLAESKGPNQTAQADLGLRWPRMSKDTFLQGAAHLGSSLL